MNAAAAFQIGQPFNPWKRFNGVFIPLGLLTHPGLSDRAKLFYGRLCLYAGKDGACFAGRKTMATDMGVSVATITRLPKRTHSRDSFARNGADLIEQMLSNYPLSPSLDPIRKRRACLMLQKCVRSKNR